MFVEYENISTDRKSFRMLDELDFAGGMDEELKVRFAEMLEIIESKEDKFVPIINAWVLGTRNDLFGGCSCEGKIGDHHDVSKFRVVNQVRVDYKSDDA